MRLLTLTLLAAASLLLSSCESAEMFMLDGSCSGDEQCADGLICHESFCVEGALNTIALRARVLPPPNTGLLQQQIPHLPLGDSTNITITLVEPVTLRGVVRHEGDGLGVNVSGELEARTPGDLPGMDYRFTAKSIEGLDEMNQGFELNLLPGRPYEVTFRPESKALPPHCFTLEADDAVGSDYNVMLPAKGDYVDLEGFVRWSTYQAIGNARVTAMLEDGLGVPSVTTDDVAGKFALRLPPDTQVVQLVVEAPEDGPIFPSFTTEWLAPSTDLAIDIPPLPPGLNPFETNLQVIAPGPDGLPIPAAGLTVLLRGDLAGGSLRRSVITDADGVARVEVLPGAYEVVISVPPGQSYAGWSGAMNLVPAEEENALELIELDPRPYVIGIVRDASGSLITDGKVVATRRKTATSGGLSFAPQPFTCGIDINGRFVLRVDTGLYDLRITPTVNTGAPPRLLSAVEVHGDIDLDVKTPSPGVARLTVLGPDGAPLPDTTIELYLPAEQGASKELPQSLLVKGTSDANGFLDLLVPFEP
jgi:hypothetical protein